MKVISACILVAGLFACQRGSGADTVAPVVEPAPPSYERKNFSDQEGACKSTEPPTEYTCEFDTDCIICHDGSACGVVVDRATYAARGDACKKEDAADCEYSRPRCCDGRCVVAGY